jgi:hypothetical protein
VLEGLGVNVEKLRTATAQLLSGTIPVSEKGALQGGGMARKPIVMVKKVRVTDLEEE